MADSWAGADVDDLVGSVEDFRASAAGGVPRRRVVAGFALARFMKSLVGATLRETSASHPRRVSSASMPGAGTPGNTPCGPAPEA